MSPSLPSRAIFRVLRCAALLAFVASVGAAADLKPFDAHSLEKIRAANKGRPFVLAFWSLHCAPCKEDMAVLKAIHAKHPSLTLVLVGTSPPGEHAAAASFLAQQKLGRIEQWAFADEFEERVRYSVDREWRGELPRTYLFDAEHRVTVQSGVLEAKTIDAWLARALRRQ